MERNGRALIDVARARGINLPMQCHVGWCLECRCRLLAGAVQMPNSIALDAAQRAAGEVLACCARPVTDDVVLDFDALA
jgi:ferredoxin